MGTLALMTLWCAILGTAFIRSRPQFAGEQPDHLKQTTKHALGFTAQLGNDCRLMCCMMLMHYQPKILHNQLKKYTELRNDSTF